MRYKFRNILLLAACFLIGGSSIAQVRADDEAPSNEESVKKAEQAVEQTGVKVGMAKPKVLELLGDKFTEVKVSQLDEGEQVLSWQKDKALKVTVTFVGDKVKAVAHSLTNPEEEDD